MTVLTILEGSTFCICDDRSATSPADTSGLFAARHALPLAARAARSTARARCCSPRARSSTSRPRSTSGTRRDRACRRTRSRSRASASSATGMQERLDRSGTRARSRSRSSSRSRSAPTSRTSSPSRTTTSRSAIPSTRSRCRRPRRRSLRRGANQLVSSDRRPAARRRRCIFSQRGQRSTGRDDLFQLELEPRERWELQRRRRPVARRRRSIAVASSAASATSARRVRRRRSPPGSCASRGCAAAGTSLRQAFDQSVADLAALRMRDRRAAVGTLPAAGMPWFMTVFGRDTLITCLQTLLLGPELAIGALDALAELQAQRGRPVDRRRAGQDRPRGAPRAGPPRPGSRATTARSTRRRSILVLLSETWRWTDDAALVQRLREPALARARAGSTATATATATASSSTSGGRRRGLENQSWKDSGDSQRFHDGSFARGADRAGRGAGLRLRREAPARRARARGLARPGARGAARARGGRAADALRRGVLGRGARRLLRARARRREAAGRLALLEHRPPALERDRPARAGGDVVDQLLGEELWSGWGIRTMSTDEAAYNPLSYHNGTVWPHDTSLARLGSRAARARGRGAADRARAARGGGALRLVAAGGVRGLRARRDAVPDRLSDRRAAAGLGGGHADPARCGCCSASSPTARASELVTTAADELPELARRARARGRPRVRAHPGTSRSSAGVSRSRRSHEDRRPQPGLVPGPAGRLRRHRVDRLAARGRARRRGPRRHALRVRRLAARARSSSPSSTTAPSEWIGHTFWELQHALNCFARHDEFDVIHDHTGCSGLALGGAARRRRSCTPCTARSTASRAISTSRSSRMAPTAQLISISLNQRKPKPNLPWIANCPERARPLVYPFRPQRRATTCSSSAA